MTIVTISSLIDSLPESDRTLGIEFILNRDILSLKDLVSSAIIKIKRELRKENPREDYKGIDLDRLQRLESEVDIYLLALGEDIEDFYTNYE